jgi:carbon monoxide dehydrogenase subunit G
MEMTGEFRIPAPRERVWQALNDPETLKRAIPGCQTIEKVTDTEFTAKVVAKVGPVRATFGGKVNLTDLDPPKAYTISGEGSGGVAGFAKGSAKVNLEEESDDATRLRYEVQAHVGGKLAQIGSRLIDATSRKMADDFFGNFVAAISPSAEESGVAAGETAATPAPASGTVAAPAASAPAGIPETRVIPPTAPQPPGLPEEVPQAPSSSEAEPPSREAETPSRRLSPAVWVTGLTAIVAGMLYYFTRKDGTH